MPTLLRWQIRACSIITETTKEVIPSHVRNIADVSGAGDTVVATAAMVYALTKDVHLMAEIANLAGWAGV
jgi:bifunctional ADP-heptose synthase (sugar kinase/adenylyltransferase)